MCHDHSGYLPGRLWPKAKLLSHARRGVTRKKCDQTTRGFSLNCLPVDFWSRDWPRHGNLSWSSHSLTVLSLRHHGTRRKCFFNQQTVAKGFPAGPEGSLRFKCNIFYEVLLIYNLATVPFGKLDECTYYIPRTSTYFQSRRNPCLCDTPTVRLRMCFDPSPSFRLFDKASTS